MSSVVTNKKLYNLLLRGWFKTKGRASRLEYICRFMLFWIIGFISINIETLDKNLTQTPLIIIIICILACSMFLLLFLTLIQVFFVTHRRLHDLNTSGWWQLIMGIPFGQILMIGLIFFKGTDGPNKYGDPPEY